jgi:hypothetical protein
LFLGAAWGLGMLVGRGKRKRETRKKESSSIPCGKL